MVKTKIICTIGPASRNLSTLRKMMLAGMDVVRLNFSHGNHAEHLKAIEMVRTLNKKYRRKVRILQDLEGYRVRIGFLKQKQIELKKGQNLYLTNKEEFHAHPEYVPFDYSGPLSDLKPGQKIFIDDGNIVLSVLARTEKAVKVKVLVPGILKERKGMNFPGLNFKFKGLTPKDRNDLEFGIMHKVDFIAQSFVRNKNDVLDVRKFIGDRLPDAGIIAKIENESGIENLEKIMEASDGIMIARGDMGVLLPIYQIPVIQKKIIRKCRAKNDFAITATQMLESMTENHIPTRAEVSDVANAILDGTDYVMLSGETAAGKYPVETVRMMNEIVKYTENFIRQENGKRGV